MCVSRDSINDRLVLRRLNVNNGIRARLSIHDTGITRDQCAYNLRYSELEFMTPKCGDCGVNKAANEEPV